MLSQISIVLKLYISIVRKRCIKGRDAVTIKKTYGHNTPQQLWNKARSAFNKAVLTMGVKEKAFNPATRLKKGKQVKFLLILAGG
jgi:hypothetical protein